MKAVNRIEREIHRRNDNLAKKGFKSIHKYDKHLRQDTKNRVQ